MSTAGKLFRNGLMLSLSAGVLLYLCLLRFTRTVGAQDLATAKDVLRKE